MPYKFATEKIDYSDFSSGQFFYSVPNQPAFPVRLGREIFQRCAAYLTENGRFPPYNMYDPCVGGGYHLVTTAFLHWHQINSILGSDIDKDTLEFTEKNFSLLTLAGVSQRAQQLQALSNKFGKPSHQNNLAIALRFQKQLFENLERNEIETAVFQANILSEAFIQNTVLKEQTIDIVFTDVPYGQMSSWQGGKGEGVSPLYWVLENLQSFLAPVSIVAIATDKTHKVQHEHYQRVDQLRLGKRKVLFYCRK